MIEFKNVLSAIPTGDCSEECQLDHRARRICWDYRFVKGGKFHSNPTINCMHPISEGSQRSMGLMLATKGQSLRRFRCRKWDDLPVFNLVTRASVISNVMNAFVPDIPLARFNWLL